MLRQDIATNSAGVKILQRTIRDVPTPTEPQAVGDRIRLDPAQAAEMVRELDRFERSLLVYRTALTEVLTSATPSRLLLNMDVLHAGFSTVRTDLQAIADGDDDALLVERARLGRNTLITSALSVFEPMLDGLLLVQLLLREGWRTAETADTSKEAR